MRKLRVVGVFQILRKPDFVLVAKLKALKGKLKEWSKTIHGNLGLRTRLF